MASDEDNPGGGKGTRFLQPIPSRSGGRDVAQLAGVSTATVSRALNSPDRVDPQTRRRVLEAAAKLRYVPHGAARSLRSHRSRMIGAVVPSFDYALYARTTSALHQRLAPAGLRPVRNALRFFQDPSPRGVGRKPVTCNRLHGEL